MKRSILFMIMMAFFTCGIIAATTDIDLRKDPPPNPIPCSMDPDVLVSATIDATDLSIYFETMVGEATLTVTVDSGQVVYQERVDTDATSEMHIPVDLWTSGNYTLIIAYDTTVLRGNFQTQ